MSYKNQTCSTFISYLVCPNSPTDPYTFKAISLLVILIKFHQIYIIAQGLAI